MLDIEVTGAVCPATNILVYFAPNTNAGFTNAIAAAVHDESNKPSVISISWGGPESTWTQPARTALDQVLRQATMQGVTVVVAAGDNGVTDGVQDGRAHVDFPSSSPWALSVGGTSLVADGNTIASEKAWNSGANGGANGGRRQRRLCSAGLAGQRRDSCAQRRQFGPRRSRCGGGSGSRDRVHRLRRRELDGRRRDRRSGPALGRTGRTSQSGRRHNLGHLNPRLYSEIGPAQILRRITEGNNATATLAGFSSGPGWNAVAGWSTPDGQKLLDWLRAHPSAP